jgi:two-component system, LytTR family, response regulator
MLNCIAVDDEKLALELLADNIRKVAYLNLVAQCRDALSAIKALKEHAIDLLFIDIQMPGISGIQFVESLAKKPMVIFVTAYREFAVEGYSLDVVDYLVKPVPIERFLRACDKALELYELKISAKNSPAREEVDYFFVNADYSLIKVHYKDVAWIQGLKDYVKIHFNNSKKPLIARGSVSAIEKILPATKFIRIHKSYILSKSAITAIRKNSVFIGTTEFIIGETYGDAIEKIIGKSA